MYNKISIPRREFFKSLGIIFGLPFLSQLGFSCSKSPTDNEKNLSQQIEKAIRQLPTYKVKESDITNDLCVIPSSVVLSAQDKAFGVFRLVIIKRKCFLEYISLNLEKKNESNIFVKGLSKGDILVYNPKASIQKLASVNRKILKEHFIKKN
ncbi:hypothetical protein B1H10_05670 [candidate division KSB1 bacterium 4484_188]|nr:MAG: hypothetical protein B1H10_05670 [candidate division KSB1 bacterium 4484_188]